MKINLLEAVFVLFIQGDLRKWNQPSAMPPLVKALAIILLLIWIGAMLAGNQAPLQTSF